MDSTELAAKVAQWRTTLTEIYRAETAATTAVEIGSLVGAYRRVFDAGNGAGRFSMNESDIVLIAYGDSLRRGGEAPLHTLRQFYRRYLADTFNGLHILPFHPYSSDDGFSVIDYFQVNPELGDWQALQALGRECNLVFDLVLNHVSSESVWFRGYLQAEEKYCDFFIECDPEENHSAVVRPRTHPLLTSFTAAGGRQCHLWTTFGPDQIDLNYRNPKVLLAVLEVLLFFIARGARALRLDAVAFLWKESGTDCIHRPQTHAIIRLIRQVVDCCQPPVLLITETNVPHQENIAYFGDGGNEAHLVYNFALPPLVALSLIKGDSRTLTAWAEELAPPGPGCCFLNFTAGHDGVGLRAVENIAAPEDIQLLVDTAVAHGGFVSYRARAQQAPSAYELNCTFLDLLTHPVEEAALRIDRLIAAVAISLAMPGMAAIYIVDLLGSGNDLEGVGRSGHYRSINRKKFDAAAVAAALEEPTSFRGAVYRRIKKLVQVRKRCRAFHPRAAFAVKQLDPRVFAVERGTHTADCRPVLALVNVSAQALTLDLGLGGRAMDLLTATEHFLDRLSMPPHAVLWLEMPA